MTKPKRNIFQQLSDMDARQQLAIERAGKNPRLKSSKRNSVKNALLIFLTVAIGLIIIGSLFASAEQDSAGKWADLGAGLIITLFAFVIVVGGAIAAIIYTIWYFMQPKDKRPK